MLPEFFALDVTNLLYIVTAFVVVLLLLRDKYENRKLPPGPKGLPIVGYLPFMRGNPVVRFGELKKKYVPIFSIRLGSQTVVCLSDFPSMKEAFSQDAFYGRPPDLNFFLNKETIEQEVFSGLAWKEKRRFTIRLLKDLGMGKSQMETHIIEEIEELLQRFEGQKGQPFHAADFLSPSTSNNISSIIFGKRRTIDDPKRILLDEIMEKGGKLFTVVGNALLLFPIFKVIVEYLKLGSQGQRLEIVNKFKKYVREEIEEHQQSPVDTNNTKDYIDGYLKEITKRKNDPTKLFHVNVLEDLIRLVFFAGSETTKNTIDWILLVLALRKDIQTKLQDEIDTVIGRSRTPSLTDRPNMLYTEAIIMEILRWRATLPMNFPRYTLEDVELNSYFIPKHTIVFSDLWAVHHDPKLWGDNVEEFVPERFLSEDGKEIIKPEYYMPFSIGKRSCPGEALAYMEVFLYLTAILQRFNIRLPEGHKPDYEGVLGVMLRPKPYLLCADLRK